jgi:Flp pilus assembly protein TadG
MSRKMLDHAVLVSCRAAWRKLAARRAGVAMIIALAAPVLVASTGFSVDVGYWYEQQESLQSAADAAALSAANAAANYSDTTTFEAEPFAVAAANKATNSQFNLNSSSLVLTVGATAASGSSTVTPWTATATIPRGSFFSRSNGLGLPGFPAGTQSASATVDVVGTTGPDCLYSNGEIYATGGAKITASNCDFYSGSTTCAANDSSAISADPSATISAQAVTTTGCAFANTSGGAYVGTNAGNAGDGATTGYQVTNHAAAQADPLASMGNPPSWPSMPAAPSSTSGASTVTANLGYGTSGAWGNCTYNGTYSGNCEMPAGTFNGLNYFSINSLLMNDASSTSATYITGGFTGYVNNTITMDGPGGYFINGGMSVGDGTAFNMAAANYVINGGTTFSNGAISMGTGTDYFTGQVNGSGVPTGWAMTLNTPSFNFSGGTWYVNGGFSASGSSPTMTLGQGTYMFSSYSGSTSPAFLGGTSGNLTFTGGTYFFNGGLTVSGATNLTFGPGIYYIENGNLNITASGSITVNGATFVLENGAGYTFSGGSTVSMTAPTASCVPPASYPEASYTSMFPYDGTDGEGICGILVYQARGDTAADTVDEGSSSTMNGVVYAPNAPLAVSGGANYGATSTSTTFAIIASSVTDTGSGHITLSAAAGGALGGGTTTNTLLLVN